MAILKITISFSFLIPATPPQKHHVKSQCILLDDSDILRTPDHKPLAPYLSTAIQNAGETCAKGKDERTVKSRTGLLSSVVKFAADSLQTYLLEYCTRLSEVRVI